MLIIGGNSDNDDNGDDVWLWSRLMIMVMMIIVYDDDGDDNNDSNNDGNENNNGGDDDGDDDMIVIGSRWNYDGYNDGCDDGDDEDDNVMKCQFSSVCWLWYHILIIMICLFQRIIARQWRRNTSHVLVLWRARTIILRIPVPVNVLKDATVPKEPYWMMKENVNHLLNACVKLMGRYTR